MCIIIEQFVVFVGNYAKVSSMKLFSPSQTEIYISAKDFIFSRLNRILEQSKSQPSQDAFFFTLSIMMTVQTDILRKVIDIFYTEKNHLIRQFLQDLNGWLKSENNDSQFIKSITDLRFIPADKQNHAYIEQLKLEFSENLAEDIKNYLREKTPQGFAEKYTMLCIKYADIIHPENSPTLSA